MGRVYLYEAINCYFGRGDKLLLRNKVTKFVASYIKAGVRHLNCIYMPATLALLLVT